MEGIVSLLDDTHYKLTEQLWAELEQRFGVRGIYVTPYPHFSYHVAGKYDVDKLDKALEWAARTSAPFTVSTSGIGVFTGPEPVIYIPAVRTLALTELHGRLWQALEGIGNEPWAYYHPTNWLPHITIGFDDITPANLPAIMQFLSEQQFNWEIRVDNLAHIALEGDEQKLRKTFKFDE
jgi:2'-5' RNA ligase